MVRRLKRQNNQSFPPIVTSIIKSEARSLARKYHRDEKQVNEILIRIFDDYQGTIHQDSVRIPRMDTVFSNISANRVLALLEKVGKQQFRELLGYVHYLENVFTPLYSLDELTDVISSFRSHLYACSVSLEETGYPDRLFTKSKWLDSLLNKLYITKLPANIRLRNGLLKYKWASRPKKGRGKKRCTYDEVECIGLFKLEDARRLDKDRHIVHSLKLKILKILHDSLKTKSLRYLWKDCLAALTKAIDHEQADFFIRMDRLYEKHGLVALGHVAFPSIACSGGLFDLFNIIGQVECELTIETHSSFRENLDKYMKSRMDYDSRIDVGKFLDEVIFRRPIQREKFVDLMRSMIQKDERLQDEYALRVNDALRTSFGKIVVDSRGASLRIKQPYIQVRSVPMTKKPWIQVNQRTRIITIYGDETHSWKPRNRLGDLVKAITFALEKCKERKELRRVYFNRKELCNQLGLATDTKMAHIFRDTPFWLKNEKDRLIKSVGGMYLYTLDVDLDRSIIIYELN